MNFIDKKNYFEQFFLIFLLIFISIPLQVHYESFDLFYFFGIVNYFKLLILVFLFSILFYLIFYKLHKEINLDGEDYIYLVSPQLDTLKSSDALVKDKFAKILLTGVPGTKIYDSFVSNPKTFDSSPLDRLDELEFQVKRYDNEFFSFNGLNYSFSLKIVEYIDEIVNSSFNSKRGIRQIVDPTE